jgi:DNA-binding SARP family transcriptional activator/predicted ATPase
METTFRLRLLGPVRIERDGEPVRGFRSRKALALLGYLAVQDKPVPREHLADLFWEDKPESRGRANLSWVLNHISAQLPDCLHADRYTVQFQRTARYWLDLDAFAELETRGDADSLAAAVALSRGAFLEGLYLDGCAEFEIWLVKEQERWRQRVIGVLEQLVARHSERGEYEQSLCFAQQLLDIEPWREEAHRQVMQLLVRTGQRSAALAQYATCRRIMAEEFGFEPTGETTVLHRRIQEAASAPQHNLPSQPAPLVGREKELAVLDDLLGDPLRRLITIGGLGGIGKTRLALEVVGRKADTFLDGAYFVPLIALTSIQALVPAIADVLDVSFSGQKDLKSQLLNYLRPRELLLVLDNFEHLLEGAGLLADMLAHAPGLKLLIPSRERLKLSWEWFFDLRHLPFPPADTTTPLESYSAYRLFEQRVCQVRGQQGVLDQEREPARQICQLVEGVPLGLELAASLAAGSSCAAIAQALARNLDALRTAWQDVPDRHRSMQAVFDHSWSLLSPEEQAAFRKLAVFRGGFRAEAAEQVAAASAAVLSALVDKSLLRLDVNSGRYDVHELVRQYAAARLNETPLERAQTEEAHCACYTAFLVQQIPLLLGSGDHARVARRIKMDLENVRCSWQWAIDHGAMEPLGQLTWGFFVVHEFLALYREGMVAFDQAIARLQAVSAPNSDVILGQLLTSHAWFAYRLGAYGQAKAELERALALLQPFGIDELLGQPLITLGLVNFAQGDYGEAHQLAQRAITVAALCGDRISESFGYWILGMIAHALGDYEQAKALSERSVQIRRELGEDRGVACGKVYVGQAAYALGMHAQAERLLQEALALGRASGDRWLIALCLHALGNGAYSQGDYDRARQLYREGLQASEEIGEQRGIALCSNGLGWASWALEENQVAEECFQDALQTAMQARLSPEALDALAGLAALMYRADRERTVALLALVQHHPASTHQTKEKVAPFLAESEMDLSPQQLAEVYSRRPATSLECAVVELLNDIVLD